MAGGAKVALKSDDAFGRVRDAVHREAAGWQVESPQPPWDRGTPP